MSDVVSASDCCKLRQLLHIESSPLWMSQDDAIAMFYEWSRLLKTAHIIRGVEVN